MADKRAEIEVGIKGADQVVAEVGRVNQSLAGMGVSGSRAFKEMEGVAKSALRNIGGEVFRAVVSERSSSRIDSAKVRKILTDEQLAEVVSEVRSTSVSLFDL